MKKIIFGLILISLISVLIVFSINPCECYTLIPNCDLSQTCVTGGCQTSGSNNGLCVTQIPNPGHSCDLDINAGTCEWIHASINSIGYGAVEGNNVYSEGVRTYVKGIYGQSNYGIGVYGNGYYGVYGTGTYGVYGQCTGANCYGLYTPNNAYVGGNAYVEGNRIRFGSTNGDVAWFRYGCNDETCLTLGFSSTTGTLIRNNLYLVDNSFTNGKICSGWPSSSSCYTLSELASGGQGSSSAPNIIGITNEGYEISLGEIGYLDLTIGNSILHVTSEEGYSYEVVNANGAYNVCGVFPASGTILLRNGNPIFVCSSPTYCGQNGVTSNYFCTSSNLELLNPHSCNNVGPDCDEGVSVPYYGCENAGNSECKNNPSGPWRCIVTSSCDPMGGGLDYYYTNLKLQW